MNRMLTEDNGNVKICFQLHTQFLTRSLKVLLVNMQAQILPRYQITLLAFFTFLRFHFKLEQLTPRTSAEALNTTQWEGVCSWMRVIWRRAWHTYRPAVASRHFRKIARARADCKLSGAENRPKMLFNMVLLARGYKSPSWIKYLWALIPFLIQ